MMMKKYRLSPQGCVFLCMRILCGANPIHNDRLHSAPNSMYEMQTVLFLCVRARLPIFNLSNSDIHSSPYFFFYVMIIYILLLDEL